MSWYKITCQNERVENGKKKICGRFMFIADAIAISELKQGTLILRCPSCSRQGRFIKVTFNAPRFEIIQDVPVDIPEVVFESRSILSEG